MKKILFIGFVSACLLTGTAVPAFAQEDGGKNKGGQDGNAAFKKIMEEFKEKGYSKEKIRDIFTKKRNGEKLTAEEEEIANKLAEVRRRSGQGRQGRQGQRQGGGQAGRGGMRPGGGMMTRGMSASPFVHVKMNPLDGAFQALSEAQFRAKKHVEAVDSLKQIMEKSPDDESKNAAHFNAASIYRQGLGYYSHAAEEYLKVNGKLRNRSLRELVEMFREANDIQLAIDTLTELAGATEDKGDKVDILQALAHAYTLSEKHDEAIETLKQIPQLITYEEAVEMKEHYTQADSDDVLQGRNTGGFNPMMMRNMMMRGRQGGGGRDGRSQQRQGKDARDGDKPPPPPPAD